MIDHLGASNFGTGWLSRPTEAMPTSQEYVPKWAEESFSGDEAYMTETKGDQHGFLMTYVFWAGHAPTKFDHSPLKWGCYDSQWAAMVKPQGLAEQLPQRVRSENECAP